MSNLIQQTLARLLTLKLYYQFSMSRARAPPSELFNLYSDGAVQDWQMAVNEYIIVTNDYCSTLPVHTPDRICRGYRVRLPTANPEAMIFVTQNIRKVRGGIVQYVMKINVRKTKLIGINDDEN